MKKILFTISLLINCIIVCVAQEDSYKIEGRLANSMNGQLLLVVNTDRGMIDIADATVSDGVFEFIGRVPEVIAAYLMPVRKNVVLATFMLENGHYEITLKENELIVKGGGESQKIWTEFDNLNRDLLRSRQELETRVRTVSPAQLQKLQQEFQMLLTKVQTEELSLLKKYSDTYVAAYAVAAAMPRVDETQLIERYDLLGEKAKSSFYGKQIRMRLDRMKNIAVGSIAADFSVPLADGGILSLHETKGKVKIIDFWASWSSPCRQENVNLLKLYRRFRPKGLEIISVSMDNNKQAWLKAIGEDGCNWKCVSDLKGQASEIAAQYCVTAIPCIFILDEENRIMAKNLRGKELEEKIDEMLKKKK